MKNIDVWKLAAEIEEVSVPQTQKEIENFINSMNGKTMSVGEIIQEVIAPLVGITNTANKKFTIELLQRTIDELQKD